MRDRADFIENLRQAYIHLKILTEDIRYPLSEERQKWLDGAMLLIGHLHNMEMKDDLDKILQEMGEQAIEQER